MQFYCSLRTKQRRGGQQAGTREWGISMSCSKARRERQREWRREKRREEMLPRKNGYGFTDLTPHNVTREDGEVIYK